MCFTSFDDVWLKYFLLRWVSGELRPRGALERAHKMPVIVVLSDPKMERVHKHTFTEIWKMYEVSQATVLNKSLHLSDQVQVTNADAINQQPQHINCS
jgi:hypothetical protein